MFPLNICIVNGTQKVDHYSNTLQWKDFPRDFPFKWNLFIVIKSIPAFFHNINNRRAMLSTNINIEIQAQYCWFFCGEFFTDAFLWRRFFVRTLFCEDASLKYNINYIKSPNQKHLNSMCIVFFAYKIRIVKKVLLW